MPARAEAVFAQVVDFTNLSAWDPLVDVAERIDDGPVRVGSEFAAVVRRGRVRMPLRYRVEELVTPWHVVVVGVGDGFREVDVIDLVEDDGGTLLTWCVTVQAVQRAGTDGVVAIPSAVPRGSMTGLSRWLADRVGTGRRSEDRRGRGRGPGGGHRM